MYLKNFRTLNGHGPSLFFVAAKFKSEGLRRKASGRTSPDVHTGAPCGKISVQALYRAPLTSRIRQSIVGLHATATVGPSFLPAIAAADSLHWAEQLPVA